MNTNETNNDNQIEQLADLEPNSEVKGGTGGVGSNGVLLNLSGNNTWAGTTTLNSGATLQLQGNLTVSGEAL